MLLLISSFAAESYAIVFVHLGNVLPDYLADATHQARLFNVSADIIVVAEQTAIQAVDRDLFTQDGVIFVACEGLSRSLSHQNFLNKTSLDTGFREGFWRKCTERFYYIEEFMSQYNFSDVFHLEYDNMLYVNLEELLPIFHRYPNIAATFDNDDRCIPGFMYFAHADAASKLAEYLTAVCNLGWNDMQAIARYKQKYGELGIGHLPIIMPAYKKKYELITPTGFSVKSPDVYSLNYEIFNSIFDAAALGQFLGGIDPRNGPSAPGFINESCVFNPSLLNFEWITDEFGRRVPHVMFAHQKCRINNLHIHSKNLKGFAS